MFSLQIIVNNGRSKKHNMDVHGNDNLIEKSCFTTRKRVFWWTLISLLGLDFSGFQESCACDHKKTWQLAPICLETFAFENFNDSDPEIEHVGSNVGDIYGRGTYLPWGTVPT